MSRSCRVCSDRLYGRSDQKFCSDHCRNRFHNSIKRADHQFVRTIQSTLSRNRRILWNVIHSGQKEIAWEHLLNMGLEPDYCTQSYWKAGGQKIYICYDVAYCIGYKNKMPDRVHIYIPENMKGRAS